MKLVLTATRPETEGVTSFMFNGATPLKRQAWQFLHGSPLNGAVRSNTPFENYPSAQRSNWASRMAIS